MTASSIFKAFLPREARATNCTSQAGQDGIHLTALPLISLLSAANQTHHVTAFCFLTESRGQKRKKRKIGKLTLTLPVWTQKQGISASLSLCLRSDFICRDKIEPQQAITLQDAPQPPHCHQDSNAAVSLSLSVSPLNS